MQTMDLLHQKMISAFPIPPFSPYFIINSFPLVVCPFIQARCYHSFRNHGADYGKDPSKKGTYFGYKIYSLITLESYITTFKITPVPTYNQEK